MEIVIQLGKTTGVDKLPSFFRKVPYSYKLGSSECILQFSVSKDIKVVPPIFWFKKIVKKI